MRIARCEGVSAVWIPNISLKCWAKIETKPRCRMPEKLLSTCVLRHVDLWVLNRFGDFELLPPNRP
jgi:hypothetical protein